MMATLPMKIRPFAIPDAVYLELPPGRKQDGLVPLPKILLKDLPEDVLQQLINDFAEAVRQAAKESSSGLTGSINATLR